MDPSSEMPGILLSALIRARRRAVREAERADALRREVCSAHRHETAAEARRRAERMTDQRMYRGFTDDELDQLAAFQARMLANLKGGAAG